MLIDIAQVNCSDRIRERENVDTDKDFEDLRSSIATYGLWVPIIVADNNDGSYELVDGERRWRAITSLYAEGKQIPDLGSTKPGEKQAMWPPGKINASVRNKLSEEHDIIIEFEMNERRKGFTWDEKAKYVRRIHEMYSKRYKDGWNQQMTAHLLNISTGSISHYLDLDEMVENHPEIAKAETLSAALKRSKTIKKIEERKRDVKRDPSAQAKRAETLVTLGDAREWIKTLADNSVDLVNFDPPWGEDVSHKVAENWEAFDDSESTATDLMDALLPEIYRVLKQDRFCIFWYRQQTYETIIETCENVGFNLKGSRTPCLWVKPDKETDQNRFPEKLLINAYENFLLLRKGNPVFHLRDHKTNIFSFARVSRGSKIHPTEKPVDLMETLVRLCTVPGELVIDPTAGSGAVFHAAYKALRKFQGCELSQNFRDRIVVRLSKIMTGE